MGRRLDDIGVVPLLKGLLVFRVGHCALVIAHAFHWDLKQRGLWLIEFELLNGRWRLVHFTQLMTFLLGLVIGHFNGWINGGKASWQPLGGYGALVLRMLSFENFHFLHQVVVFPALSGTLCFFTVISFLR